MATKLQLHLLDNIAKLHKNDDDFDVNIDVGTGEHTQRFQAHSLILRAGSPYFRTALSKTWATKDDGMIIFKKPNLTPAVFDIILKYVPECIHIVSIETHSAWTLAQIGIVMAFFLGTCTPLL